MAKHGQKRKRTKSSTLEDTLKAQDATKEEYTVPSKGKRNIEEVVWSLPRPESKTECTKRGRKKTMAPVDEVREDNSIKVEKVVNEVEQAPQNPAPETHPNDNGQASAEAAASQMPEKRLLVLVIDILKKIDVDRVFTQPVDARQAPGYYDIVKNPMDLFSLKKKLDTGCYGSLEAFKKDLLLIFRNAELYNEEDSPYTVLGRMLKELTENMLDTLRNDPCNFESKFDELLPRKRGRRPKCEAGNSTSVAPTASNAPAAGGECGYRPRKSCNENKQLISEVSSSSKPVVPSETYYESLMQFSEGFEPTVQMVADRKLQQYQLTPPSPQIPPLSEQQGTQTTNVGDGIDIHDASRYETRCQGEIIELPINGFGDFNLPVDDDDESTKYGSYMSMMVDANKPEARRPSDTSAPRTGVPDMSLASGLFSSPFLAMMRESSSSQLSKAAVDSESGMVAQGPNYGVSLAQQTRSTVPELSLLSSQSAQSLHGESPNYVSSNSPQAHLLVEEGRHHAILSLPVSGLIPTRRLPDSSNTASLSQMFSFLEKNQPSNSNSNSNSERSQHSSAGQSQGFDAFSRLGNGVNNPFSQHSSAGQNQGFAAYSRLGNGFNNPFSQHSSAGQSQGSAAYSRLGNGVNNPFSQARVSSYTSGGNQTMATLFPNAEAAPIAVQLFPKRNQHSTQGTNSSPLYGDNRMAIHAPVQSPVPSYGNSNLPHPSSESEWRRRLGLGAQYGDTRQGMNTQQVQPMPSYGVLNSPHPNPQLAWSQNNLCGGQTAAAAANNGSCLHNIGMMNSWNQNGFVRPEALCPNVANSDATSSQLYGTNMGDLAISAGRST